MPKKQEKADICEAGTIWPLKASVTLADYLLFSYNYITSQGNDHRTDLATSPFL